MSITLKEVANACGVSITTVSLVLNDRPNRISEDVKARILETVERLNYKPNPIAVSMITKKTNIWGLILPDISNLYFSELAKVIEQNAYQSGYNIIYGNTTDSIEHTFEYFDFFYNRGVDGIIIIYSNKFNDEDKAKLNKLIQEADIPVIILDRFLAENRTTTILVDHRKGGYIATKHLLDLGHKVIGCITGPKHIVSSNERLLGYKDALKEAHIPFDESLIYHGDFQPHSGIKALESLLPKKVTAIFSFNDMMAIGFFRECKKRKIRIPEDISVIGYDDIILSELLDPPLTTITQPIDALGKEAVLQMLEMMKKNDHNYKNIILNPSLKVRESTQKK
ncbi:MAG: LacI family DNA-binding transcriptional regulator [Longicatena sp.]